LEMMMEEALDLLVLEELLDVTELQQEVLNQLNLVLQELELGQKPIFVLVVVP